MVMKEGLPNCLFPMMGNMWLLQFWRQVELSFIASHLITMAISYDTSAGYLYST
jgi:hypothetical protein